MNDNIIGRLGLWAVIVAAAALTLLSSASALEPKDIPNVLPKAKVGDWALYNVSGANMQQKWTVTQLDKESARVKYETIQDGSTINVMEIDIPTNTEVHPDANPDLNPKVSKGTSTVKGRKLDCYVLEVSAQGMETTTYISDSVPVTGVVKSQIGGSTALELIDYGQR